MNRRIKDILILSITAALIVAFVLIYIFVPEIQKLWHKSAKIPDKIKLLSYKLPKNKFLTFQFPPNSKAIRLSLRPVADINYIQKSDIKYVRYSFIYQYYNSRGKLIVENTFHIRQTVKPSSIGIAKTRYEHPNKFLQPLSARLLNIASKDINGGILKVKLVRADSVIRSVILRVRYLHIIPKRDRKVQWHHLGKRWKDIFLDKSIYGSSYIKDKEKEHIVKRQWTYVAPVGIPNRDFQEFFITVLRKEVEPITPPSVALANVGMTINNQRSLVVTLNSPENHILLRLFDPSKDYNPSEKNVHFKIYLHYYGRKYTERQFKTISVNKLPSEFNFKFPAGVLECSSNRQVFATLSQIQKGKLTRLVYPRYSRVYSLAPQKALRYKLMTLNDNPSLMRVNVRRQSESKSKLENFKDRVTYKFFDKKHNQLYQNTLSISREYSNLDYSIDKPNIILSEPISYYFALPNNVKYVEFYGKNNLLINAFSRPYQSYRKRRIPEDFVALTGNLKREPGWYLILPQASDRLIRQNQSQVLWLQRRPPSYQDYLINQNYQVRRIYPRGFWRGYDLMVPAEGSSEIEPGSASSFVRVQSNQKKFVNFSSRVEKYYLMPSLLLLGTLKHPANVTVKADGQQVLFTVYSMPYFARLFDLRPGDHHVFINAPQTVSSYINYTATDEPHLLKQLVYPFQKTRKMLFEIKKKHPGKLKLVNRLYLPHDQHLKAKVHIDINFHHPPRYQPWTTWTYMHREYLIQPNGKGVSFPLQNHFKLGLGRVFSYSLDEDLPVGIYTISIRLLNVPKAYLSMLEFLPAKNFDFQFRRRLKDPES